MKRSLVGGILVCLLESQRGSETQGKGKERKKKERDEEGKSVVRI